MMSIILLLLEIQQANAQKETGKPCADYDNSRDIEGMREILLADGIFYLNLRIAYAEAINHNIGKRIVSASRQGINEVLDNTRLFDLDFVNPADYENGVRYGNRVDFTSLTGQPSEKWAAYMYEGEPFIYAKVSCMNPQKRKNFGSFVMKKPEGIPYKKPEGERNLSAEKVKSKYSDPLPLEDSQIEESILFEEEDSPVVDLKLSKEKNPWLFKSIPNWLEVPLMMAAGYGLYKAGDFAWYHWIKTPKPLPATIWMDPPLDPVVKSFPGVIQPQKSFTLTISL